MGRVFVTNYQISIVLFSGCEYDMIFVTESWLDDTVSASHRTDLDVSSIEILWVQMKLTESHSLFVGTTISCTIT